MLSERTKATLLLLLAVLYVLSPIDIVPDAVPVLGNGDDLVAMYAGLGRFFRSRQPG